MKPIHDIVKKVNIPENKVTYFGDEIAKLNYSYKGPHRGKLILVTAINPTTSGEGKTTMAIGINDALNDLKSKSIVVLREPSLGPIFGVKGGATGAGRSQVIPSDKINLHFTGDLHAITTANNLIAAVIDDHIHQGNDLKINKVFWKRALDVNDRSLRHNFIITAASEIMAVLCLADSFRDLKQRLNNIVFGSNNKNQPLYLEELNITGSLLVILKDAVNPNLVQTKSGNPAIIHGGPFANVAHGTSSIFSIKQALTLADIVVTEAGFGADLGAEKFIDIVSKQGKISPDLIVLVATVKGLKHQGNGSLEKGFEHLNKHIENLKKFNANFVVAVNKFTDDEKADLSKIKEWCNNNKIDIEIANVFDGNKGGAKKLAQIILQKSNFYKKLKPPYFQQDSINTKMSKLATEIYGAKKVVYSDEAKSQIKWLEKHKLDRKYICVAKTPTSFSDKAKLLGAPKGFDIKVENISLSNGADFIVVECGKINRMPGLGKKSRVFEIEFIANKIKGV